MLRSPRLRLVAALFAFCSAAFAASPASAQTTAAAPEAALAKVVRSFNPALTLAKAQAYARSVLADAWRTHLDPKFIMSIVTVESRWNANAVSRVGAQGLGQLMPGTAAHLGVNPRNPAENLRGTSSYLKSLMNHFAGRPDALKLAIAGYNAGPQAVERYHGVPPYAETQAYVRKVLHVWNQLDARVGTAFTAKTPVHVAKAPVHVAKATSSTNVYAWLNQRNLALARERAKAATAAQPAPTVHPAAPTSSDAPASVHPASDTTTSAAPAPVQPEPAS